MDILPLAGTLCFRGLPLFHRFDREIFPVRGTLKPQELALLPIAHFRQTATHFGFAAQLGGIVEHGAHRIHRAGCRDAEARLLAGPLDTEVKLGLERADGSHFETEVRRQVYSAAPNLATDKMPSGNAYIRFDGFQPSITKEFRQALERFRNSPGLIVDLRRNGGGDLGVLVPIAGYFFDKKTLFAKDETRSGKPLSEFAGVFRLPLELYVGRSGEQIYSGPVVVLIDSRSASSSEVFAAGMQDSQRARIVGSQSCGCVLGIAKPRVMKGGGVLEMSEVLWFSPKGRRLEGTGILPDQTIVPTLKSLQANEDPALVAADRALMQMIASARRPSKPTVKSSTIIDE